ncbi:MAG: sensor histidine kinase [Gammaproteobacteria bacterium]
MRSIRFYLVAATLACITLINFVSALHGYRASMDEAQRLFDIQLDAMARMLASARQKRDAIDSPDDEGERYVVFQVWRDDGTLALHSDNAPAEPIAPLEPGFRDRNFEGRRWRIYVQRDAAMKEWTVVAERSDIRYALAEKVILESVLPTVLALPVVALMIWFIVGLGLKPLRRLSRQLIGKKADDLAPIIMAAPVELQSLVESANGLLGRLEASFLREKRFAADAAHELRTPISVLKVHLYNLESEWPGHTSLLMPLKESIDRMGHLVEQILALYRTSPDQYMAKFEEIELFELTRTTIASVYDRFDEKRQTIELRGGPSRMTGDRFALETLLQNLLVNACKYAPVNGNVLATVEPLTGGGTMLCVEDSGPGIPEDKYERVFERFYRLDGDRQGAGMVGCGLGLAIVKHIAELHGASVRLGPSRFETGLGVTLEFPGKKTKSAAGRVAGRSIRS